ncbi:MAG: cation transporter [Mariniphaga sp.]|jgi:copper chaperone CopZ|nr:cation transporter [Mariniphaga sp.]
MKTKILSLTTFFLITTAVAFAGEKTEKFKVYGNCGMCESRIEKAANSVDGVSAADWDKKSKMIEVKFDDSKTSVDVVHKAIAKVGHDTEMHKAKDSVYNDLPGCCKYDRTEKEKSKEHDHEGHQH